MLPIPIFYLRSSSIAYWPNVVATKNDGATSNPVQISLPPLESDNDGS